MQTTTVTVTHPTLRRKWGFGYSTTPERNSTRIIPPSAPYYTGTLRQVRAEIASDRTLRSLGNTLHVEDWFYDGKRIVGIGHDMGPHVVIAWLRDLDNAYLRGRPVPQSVTLILAD